MDKAIQFLIRFRQTNGYKFISYTTYIWLILMVILATFINMLGLMQGMGGLIFFILPAALLSGLASIFILIFLSEGVAEVESPQGNTNILHDIGVIFCIICYLRVLLGLFSH